MALLKLNELDGINKNELSMIEVAHAILEETSDVMSFNDLLVHVQKFLDLTEKDLETRMTRFYTDLNVNGSFISLGENRWGLREWYPIDSIDEEILSSIDEEEVRIHRKKRKKMNAFATSAEDDVIDYNDDDPEDTYESIDEDDDEALEDDSTDIDEDIVEDLDDTLDDDLDDVPESIEDDLTIIDDDFEELDEDEDEEDED